MIHILFNITTRFRPLFIALASLMFMMSLSGCSVAPPKNINNVCSMFDEYYDWYNAAKEVERRYKIPEAVSMAFIHQESKFIDDNRPPRRWYFGFIPGRRPSSAYGYAQALDGTWDEYRRLTGQWGADRDDFEDAIDFVGWYNQRSAKRIGVPRHDAYNLYLAYHEGAGGFLRGTHKKKPWLLKVASKVQRRSNQYQKQLTRCRKSLEKGKFWRSIFG